MAKSKKDHAAETATQEPPAPRITKTELLHLNNVAANNNYNRVICQDYLREIPDDATFSLRPIMVHEHAQGRRVAAHLRCFVTPDNDKSNIVMLDVPMDEYATICADILTRLEEEEKDAKTPLKKNSDSAA